MSNFKLKNAKMFFSGTLLQDVLKGGTDFNFS